eukprot:TRINITY_DN36718_c0_g1_i1.p1 TRINITY_DN36718_c0_g1~~TRINITY_DN36718_c0_g1_i1.p1  ORF type:complete len:770 (-),score=150.06 TRINITY_DN36718_c0_g1_i1:57-2366(-)
MPPGGRGMPPAGPAEPSRASRGSVQPSRASRGSVQSRDFSRQSGGEQLAPSTLSLGEQTRARPWAEAESMNAGEPPSKRDQETKAQAAAAAAPQSVTDFTVNVPGAFKTQYGSDLDEEEEEEQDDGDSDELSKQQIGVLVGAGLCGLACLVTCMSALLALQGEASQIYCSMLAEQSSLDGSIKILAGLALAELVLLGFAALSARRERRVHMICSAVLLGASAIAWLWLSRASAGQEEDAVIRSTNLICQDVGWYQRLWGCFGESPPVNGAINNITSPPVENARGSRSEYDIAKSFLAGLDASSRCDKINNLCSNRPGSFDADRSCVCDGGGMMPSDIVFGTNLAASEPVLGTLQLTVTSPAQFANDPNVAAALQTTLAAICDAPLNVVELTGITTPQAPGQASASSVAAQATTAIGTTATTAAYGQVQVSFIVHVPPDTQVVDRHRRLLLDDDWASSSAYREHFRRLQEMDVAYNVAIVIARYDPLDFGTALAAELAQGGQGMSYSTIRVDSMSATPQSRIATTAAPATAVPTPALPPVTAPPTLPPAPPPPVATIPPPPTTPAPPATTTTTPPFVEPQSHVPGLGNNEPTTTTVTQTTTTTVLCKTQADCYSGYVCKNLCVDYPDCLNYLQYCEASSVVQEVQDFTKPGQRRRLEFAAIAAERGGYCADWDLEPSVQEVAQWCYVTDISSCGNKLGNPGAYRSSDPCSGEAESRSQYILNGSYTVERVMHCALFVGVTALGVVGCMVWQLLAGGSSEKDDEEQAALME